MKLRPGSASMKIIGIIITCLAATTLSAQKAESFVIRKKDTAGITTLIVFFDWLRPDYITA
jgi:hypothetical protein